MQSKSRLEATKTPPWTSLTPSLQTASKDSAKIFKILMSGIIRVHSPK